MSEDTKLKQLIINTLSPEQMPEVLSETEIYLVEDDAEYATVEELATKQDVINDLDTIRDGASKGATALQTVPIAKANVVGGVAGGNWLTVNQSTGKMECGELTLAQYNSALGYTFISKTTLENRLVNEQDKLVSGTNIKTINGESVLGSGDLEIKTGYHPDIFSIKWSDHIINDMQWLRADTFSWQSGDVYVTAYNTLVNEYQLVVIPEETEGNITFKRSNNGFKIATADMESAILNKYNSEGIAWYYILDTTNKRFKLPRTKFGFKALRDTVGNDIYESLPNIEGSIGGLCANGGYGTGAFSNIYGVSSMGFGSNIVTTYGTNFNASSYSSTYQNGAQVQERATQMYLYFYVGEYAREAIEQTAGIKEELFNNKVDRIGESTIIKSTYVNDTSGYRIWSDGYCEQWGRINVNETSTSTVTFLKTFKDTNYCVLGIQTNQSTAGDTEVGIQITPSTTKTLIISTHYINPNTTNVCWKASGYLAEGEY